MQLNRGQSERIGTTTKQNTDQCHWLITSPLDTRLEITFLDLNLRGSPNCRADALSVFDGTSLDSSQLLQACGNWQPQRIVTSGAHALVKFLATTTTPSAFFHAIVRVVERSQSVPSAAINWQDSEIVVEPNIAAATPSPYDVETPEGKFQFTNFTILNVVELIFIFIFFDRGDCLPTEDALPS